MSRLFYEGQSNGRLARNNGKPPKLTNLLFGLSSLTIIVSHLRFGSPLLPSSSGEILMDLTAITLAVIGAYLKFK